ncbi:MAG: hypothetical protein PHV34_05580 [Verrucomicrobiae bacterium]|nr:hypothetical protein [Verrucomicrobiae bacterium]
MASFVLVTIQPLASLDAETTGVADRKGEVQMLPQNSSSHNAGKPAAGPLAVSLKAGPNASEVFVEWPAGGKISAVYSTGFCELGNAGGIINISGGIAVAAPGLKEAIGKMYSHSCYPVDYADDRKPQLELFADDVSILKMEGSGGNRTGALCQTPQMTAREVRIVLSGRLKVVDMDVIVEKRVAADVPRMVYSRMVARYTRDVMINCLYHQLI